MFYFSHLPRIYSKLKHLKASYITRDDRDSVYHDIFSLGRYVRFQISQKCFVIHKLRADLQRPPWPPKNDRQSPSPSVPSCGRKTLQLPVVKYEGPWFLQGLHCQLDVRLILPGNGHMEWNQMDTKKWCFKHYVVILGYLSMLNVGGVLCPRDPGSPKLRMVSWKLKTMRFGGDWTSPSLSQNMDS